MHSKGKVMMAQPEFTGNVTDRLPKLRAHARSLTRDAHDADDLEPETLIKAFRYHERFAKGRPRDPRRPH